MLRLHHGLLRLLLLRLLLLHGHDVGLLRPALLLHREVTRTWWRSGSRELHHRKVHVIFWRSNSNNRSISKFSRMIG